MLLWFFLYSLRAFAVLRHNQGGHQRTLHELFGGRAVLVAEGPVAVLITSYILMVSFLLKLGLLYPTTQLQPALF